ncbi:MAG: S8 family serine peptidase [Bacillota bacterium]
MKAKLRGLIIILTLIVAVLAAVGSAEAFSDLKNQWPAREADLLASRRVLTGYPDGTFRPQESVTRAQLAAIIVRALGMENEAAQLQGIKPPYRDLPSGYWANGYIQVARELGLVAGFNDGTFRPGVPVQRDQMTTVLVRSLNYDLAESTLLQPLPFTDSRSIGVWARPAVAVAIRRGLVGGFSDGTFRPALAVTRAQAAAFLARFLQERGAQYDFQARLSGVDSTGKLKIRLGDRELIFATSPGVVFYQGDKSISLSELSRVVPRDIYFNLNLQGAVTFVMVPAQSVTPAISLSLYPITVHAQVLSARTSWISPLKDIEGSLLMEPEGEYPSWDPVDPEDKPWESLQVTKEEMGVAKMSALTKTDGSGQVIAIIDSGVDAGHPDLQLTTGGLPKIIDWVDLTEEGLIDTSTAVAGQDGSLQINGRKFNVAGIVSRSNTYRYGFLREQELGYDMNGNGSLREIYLVLVADTRDSGLYDRVYIDTNGNGDLTDELALSPFRDKYQVVFIESLHPRIRFSLVLAELRADGQSVTFGFDNSGHGTHVAGIAAANGQIQGVAPGAQLLVIKAANERGEFDWDTLIKAIDYAAKHGADIINLSLGYYEDDTPGNNTLAELVNGVSLKAGIVFTIASGNSGPGLHSLASPADADRAISAGAYVSPAMWKRDYGWDVMQDTLWYFSSLGPRRDGAAMPTVVAPGSAVSTYPLWSGYRYQLQEGTSMAAPHVAGAVALLREAANKSGIVAGVREIKQALEEGARPLPGFTGPEMGRGVLNLPGAWDYLLLQNSSGHVGVQTYNERYGSGPGIYARETIPGILPASFQNDRDRDLHLTWKTDVSWIEPGLAETLIPQGSSRTLPISYQVPAEPGMYTGWLTGDDPATYGIDVELPVTVIRPYSLDKANGYKMSAEGSLGAAQFSRYFFHVDPGTKRLVAEVSVPQDSLGRYEGRIRIHIIDPSGKEIKRTDYAGFGPKDTIIRGSIQAAVDDPEAGTWEVVLYSSATLSLYNRQQSNYRFSFRLEGVPVPSAANKPMPYLVGLVSKPLVAGEKNYLTIQVRDAATKKPVEGPVEINGLVYQLSGGTVTFPVIPVNTSLTLNVGLPVTGG